MEELHIPTTVPLTEAVQMVPPEPTPPIYIPPARKKFPILITFLLILLAFFATICVYLFIQIRELNTQLTATPTPISTPLSTPVPSVESNIYTCPKGEWVDCMPTPDTGVRLECTPEYLSWAKENCPGFKGAAL